MTWSADTETRSRRAVQEGDVIEVREVVVEYGLVLEPRQNGPSWVYFPRSGTRVRRRALGPVWVLEDVDALLGYDTADSAHLWNRTASVVSVREHGVESRTYSVGPDDLAGYLRWLESDHDRRWIRDTMDADLVDQLVGLA